MGNRMITFLTCLALLTGGCAVKQVDESVEQELAMELPEVVPAPIASPPAKPEVKAFKSSGVIVKHVVTLNENGVYHFKAVLDDVLCKSWRFSHCEARMESSGDKAEAYRAMEKGGPKGCDYAAYWSIIGKHGGKCAVEFHLKSIAEVDVFAVLKYLDSHPEAVKVTEESDDNLAEIELNEPEPKHAAPPVSPPTLTSKDTGAGGAVQSKPEFKAFSPQNYGKPVPKPVEPPNLILPQFIIVWSAEGCDPCHHLANDLKAGTRMKVRLRTDRPAKIAQLGTVPVLQWTCPNGETLYIADWNKNDLPWDEGVRALLVRIDKNMRANMPLFLPEARYADQKRRVRR